MALSERTREQIAMYNFERTVSQGREPAPLSHARMHIASVCVCVCMHLERRADNVVVG